MELILIILGILLLFFVIFPVLGFIIQIADWGFSTLWFFSKKAIKFILWILVILFVIAALCYN